MDIRLESLGIDSEAFERYASPCLSTYSFPSVALGCADHVVHCQMHGPHTLHKAIYHGYPHEWSDVVAPKLQEGE